MKYLRAMLVVLMMPFAAAHATLITVDSPLGPSTALIDTNTGLEWLKFSATRNMSINEVFANMQPGGSLENFHYATGSEFRCVISPNTQSGCGSGFNFNDVPAAQAFFNLFGVRLVLPEDGFVTFYQVDPPGSKSPREAFIASFILYSEPVPHIELDTQLIPLSQTALNERPRLHWLVGEAQAVPEPSTLALLGIGVIALARWRKKGTWQKHHYTGIGGKACV